MRQISVSQLVTYVLIGVQQQYGHHPEKTFEIEIIAVRCLTMGPYGSSSTCIPVTWGTSGPWWHYGPNQVSPTRAVLQALVKAPTPVVLVACAHLPSHLGHHPGKTLVIEIRAVRCPTMGPYRSFSSIPPQNLDKVRDHVATVGSP